MEARPAGSAMADDPATGGEVITAGYRWTADEAIAAQNWHWRHSIRRPFRILLYVSLWIVVGCLVFALVEPGGDKLGTAALLVGLVSYLGYWLLFPWRTRRWFRRRPDSEVDVEWTLGPQGLTARTPHARTELSWDALEKVVFSPAGLLLYSTSRIFDWLPRSAFQPDGFRRATTLARNHARQFIAAGIDPTRCGTCGYDLRGSLGDCPECGVVRRV